ncbi:unnamed protein product [Prorocentrum cordatum]|uniref:PIPK domain-containing protein n=1 Tax=Prorocentrum cordatum TaxID=2364126 RepID=A0ABN9VJL8_9DINO|nr:unnamed protein product [Polarella glacialis]
MVAGGEAELRRRRLRGGLVRAQMVAPAVSTLKLATLEEQSQALRVEVKGELQASLTLIAQVLQAQMEDIEVSIVVRMRRNTAAHELDVPVDLAPDAWQPQDPEGLRRTTTPTGGTVRLATGHIPATSSSWVPVAGPSVVAGARGGGRGPAEDAAWPAPDWNPAEGVWSSDGRFLYTLGLIDLLIPYYWKKKLEAASYEVIYCGSTASASAVAPEAYAERQADMMARICKIKSQRSDDEEDSPP